MRPLTLCLTVLLICAKVPPAGAQSLHCAPRAQVLDTLSQLEQSRRAMGQAGQAVMELFAHATTARWTLTATFPDGRMCRLAHGTGFEQHDGAFPIPGTRS